MRRPSDDRRPAPGVRPRRDEFRRREDGGDARRVDGTGGGGLRRPAGEGRPRIAIARDSAFAFVYPATMEYLRAAADVRTFSPVAGDDLPAADGIYLPGGYPELYVDDLDGSPTLAAIAAAAAAGTPVYGECGGLMALCESLTTADGETGSMAGVLPATVTMRDRYQALDHAELRAREPTPVAEEGATRRGHEFHYSSLTLDGDARLAFDVTRGDGITGDADGLIEYNTLGTYCHSHAAAGTVRRFVDRAAESER